MTETEDDWVHLAMRDACLVADLLLSLLTDRAPPSHSWLDWTVRCPRTRPLPKNPDAFSISKPKLDHQASPRPRASPSTPLSWSAATSTSGGASEESPPSPPDNHDNNNNCHAARSKAPSGGRAPNTTASGALTVTTAGKRPRQKKRSLFELKEEESLLLKERRSLEQELVSLRLRVEEERAANESLKRLKVNTGSTKQEQSHSLQRDAADVDLTPLQPRGPSCYLGQNKAGTLEKTTLLPDLNLPLEE